MYTKTLYRNLSLDQPIIFHARDEGYLRDRIRLWTDLNQDSCDGLCYLHMEDVHNFARMNCEEVEAFRMGWHEDVTDEELMDAIKFWIWSDWEQLATILTYEDDVRWEECGWEVVVREDGTMYYTYLFGDYPWVDDLQVSVMLKDQYKIREKEAWAWLDAQNDFLNEVFR